MYGFLRPLVESRELARALIWRELVVRYKRSVLGVGWALIEPLVIVATYVIVFGHFLGASRSVENYSLFALFGIVPWIFLSSTIEQSGATLLDHANLARKIRFPWEFLVLAVVVSRFSTLLIGVGLGLLAACAFAASGDSLRWSQLWLLPVGIVEIGLMVTGLCLLISALNPILRDTLFLVRFAMRIGFFFIPAAYPLTLVPASVRPFYELNPLVGTLWCFQAFASPAEAAPSTLAMVIAAVTPVVALVVGWTVFRRLRPLIADLL